MLQLQKDLAIQEQRYEDAHALQQVVLLIAGRGHLLLPCRLKLCHTLLDHIEEKIPPPPAGTCPAEHLL